LKRLTLIALFLCFCSTSISQNQEQARIDSLKQALRVEKIDTQRCNILNELVDLTGNEEWPFYNRKLKMAAQESLKGMKENHPKYKTLTRHLSIAYNNEGVLRTMRGELDSAILLYQKCLTLYSKNNLPLGLAESYNNLGATYERKGDIPKAIENYDKSLSIRERENDEEGMAAALNNIGLVYFRYGADDLAKKAFNRCLELESKSGSEEGIARIFHNLGLIYDRKEKYEKALFHLDSSLAIFERLKYDRGIAYSLKSIALIYNKVGRMAESKAHLERSLGLYRKSNNKRGICEIRQALAEIAFNGKNIIRAEKEALVAHAMALEMTSARLTSTTADLLYRIYKSRGQLLKALKFFELKHEMQKKINNTESNNSVIRQQLNSEFRDKERVYQMEQEKKAMVLENKAKTQTYITVFSIIMLVLALAFLFVLLNRFKLSKKQQRIISMKEQLTKKQNLLLEKKNAEITDSIRYARRIQSAILPSESFIKSNFPESFIFYQPKDIVAGDFYWVEEAKGLVFFATADCTGHGVPGAMVSVVCHNALNRCAHGLGYTDADEIVNKTREIVVSELGKSDEEVNDGMDISLSVYDPKTLKVKWTGANNALWIVRAGELIIHKGDKQPVGKYSYTKPFTQHEIQLQKGDMLYSFTDGYLDQFGGDKGKKFKSRQMRELILSIAALGAEEQGTKVHSRFFEWKGALDQIDDVCVLGIRI
jgi:serine phosphatase RsbU (regulator of sigma subunit)